jgi:hypothetical protein
MSALEEADSSEKRAEKTAAQQAIKVIVEELVGFNDEHDRPDWSDALAELVVRERLVPDATKVDDLRGQD